MLKKDGARFDFRIKAKIPPAEQPVLAYEEKIQGDEILIRKRSRI